MHIGACAGGAKWVLENVTATASLADGTTTSTKTTTTTTTMTTTTVLRNTLTENMTLKRDAEGSTNCVVGDAVWMGKEQKANDIAVTPLADGAVQLTICGELSTDEWHVGRVTQVRTRVVG